MNKGWLIGVIVILIIVGSIGSAYMLRSVGSVAIDATSLKQTTESQQLKIDELTEQVATLVEQQATADGIIEGLESDNLILKEKMTFIGEQLVNIPGVMARFGTIRDMRAESGFISFELDVKEWLTGEAAMTYLIDEFGLSIEDAMDELPNGFYIRDIPDEPIIYRLDKSAFINLIEGSELYESDLSSLIKLVTDNEGLENFPMFYLYVVDDVVIEIDEQYIP